MNINNFDFIFNHFTSSDLYYFYYNIAFLKNDLFYLTENIYYNDLNNYNLIFKINNKLFNYYYWNTTYTFYKVLAIIGVFTLNIQVKLYMDMDLPNLLEIIFDIFFINVDF
jgi:hypothetical protein